MIQTPKPLAHLLRFTPLALIFLVVFYIAHTAQVPSSPPVIPSGDQKHSTTITNHFDSVEQLPPCPPLAGIGDIYVILKTGALGAATKLPVHFNTTLRCVPDWVVYSDFAETIGPHHIHDSLDEVSASIADLHPEFAIYRRLKAYGKATLVPEQSGRDSAGWKLDKWKFLPIMDKAWRDRPEAKWFFFLEDDTFVSWSNLLHYLSRLDPKEPFYAGAQMQIDDTLFAHGGSGFIISNEAMRLAVAKRRGSLVYYDDLTAREWAGDCVLGALMRDAGAEVFWAWPNFQGETPATLDYSALADDKSVWCYAALTFHHMNAAEIQTLWDMDANWAASGNREPWLYADVFEHIVEPEILSRGPVADEWDNLSTEDEQNILTEPGRSPESQCRSVCEAREKCVQYSINDTGKVCRMSSKASLGRFSTAVQSGWLLDRVRRFRERKGKCTSPSWVLT